MPINKNNVIFLSLFFLSFAIHNIWADAVSTTLITGAGPVAIAIDSITNKIYVANDSGNNVTVINGTDNTTATVAAGASLQAIAVNPVTNKIYTANSTSNNVTIIDGATNATTTVNVGTHPMSIAVNPVTNRIYVSNNGSGTVSIIDGNSNAVISTLLVGTQPYFLSINTVTNKIYVPNSGSNNVTVINGADNTTTTVSVGSTPYASAVNPVTNKIYIPNSGSNNVTIIDGVTNSTSTVNAGAYADGIAVNQVTNKIYVANASSNTVTVIDGATNATATVSVGNYPIRVAINPVTNKVYVANSNSNSVTIIDGATNSTTTLGVGTGAWGVSINSITNKIYVTNYKSRSVTVIAGTPINSGSRQFQSDANTVALYHFNEGSGTTLIDSSGNGNNGTINNCTWATTNGENSLYFNGTNSYVALGAYLKKNSTAWNASAGFTLEAIFYLLSAPTNDGIIIYLNNRNGETDFTVNADTTVKAGSNGVTAGWVSPPERKISAFPALLYVAFTYNKSKEYVYVNGVKRDSCTFSDSLKATTDGSYPPYLGQYHSSLYFRGYILESRISSMARPDTTFSNFWSRYIAGTAVIPLSPQQKSIVVEPSSRITLTAGSLRYFLPASCYVSAKYYDIKGRIIASFINQFQSAGDHSFPVPISSWAKGTYLQVFEAGNVVKKDKIVLMR